eukprot:s945_g20.t1
MTTRSIIKCQLAALGQLLYAGSREFDGRRWQSCGISNRAAACEGHCVCLNHIQLVAAIFGESWGPRHDPTVQMSSLTHVSKGCPGCVQRFTKTLQPQKCGREDLPLEVCK